ncbi:MAG: EpsG family protein [Oscillospiraceae bacterium]|nr:EpsG family protein [Oscillospiraceae bacterium]
MNIYSLLVALVLVTALLMRGYQAGNKKYIVVACILLFSVYGLRDCYSIGNDSSTSYLHQFQKISTSSWADVFSSNQPYNKGYDVLNKIVSDLTNGDYQVFISLIAAFVTISFGIVVYRYSPNPLTSILYFLGLMLYTFHFSALKQSIAMACLMLAFIQIVNRKPFHFVLITLIASLFHFPAIVFLPAYWISMLKPGRYYLLLLFVLLFLTYQFRSQILTWMLSIYKDENNVNVNIDNIQFLRTKALVMIIIVVVAVLFRKPKAEDRIYSILLEFIGIAIVFQTFCGYNNIFERLADFYFQFSVLLLPMVFDKNADREPLFGWRLMSVIDTIAPYLFCGFGIYRFITSTMSIRFLYPFKFFFQS